MVFCSSMSLLIIADYERGVLNPPPVTVDLSIFLSGFTAGILKLCCQVHTRLEWLCNLDDPFIICKDSEAPQVLPYWEVTS